MDQFDPNRLPYASSSSMAPFRLDEGFSEDSASQDENGRIFAATAARFQEWVMAQNEEARAEIAYEVLRTLRTSNIAGVVDRLTPLLHMDPLEKLPPEITSQVFSYLDAETLLVASLASHSWRLRITDTMLWQRLYQKEGWGINQREIEAFEARQRSVMREEFRKARAELPGPPSSKKRATSDWLAGRKISADVSQWREQHGMIEADTDVQSSTDSSDDQEMRDAPENIQHSPPRPKKRSSQDDADDMDIQPDSDEDLLSRDLEPAEQPFMTRLTTSDANGEQRLNWMHLYKQRLKLEHNWTKGRFNPFQLPHPSYPEEAHTECVYTIQFHGRWLVSGSRDKSLRIWDLETQRLRGKPLTGHSQSVLCLQFDPSEQEDVIISGSSDSSVIIWRFSTGQQLHEIRSAHEESVLNLRFDHRYLVTCSKDRKIKIWNRNQLTAMDKDYPRLRRDTPAKAPSYIVNTSEMDSAILQARILNGSVRTLKPYTLLLTLEGHSAAVNAIQIQGDLIVSASGDRLIKLWNAKDGRNLRTMPGHQKGIACVQFDGKRIVSGSSDNTVRIYDPDTSAEVAVLNGHNNLVRTVQAGFGDLPGNEDELTEAARAAELKYWKTLTNGEQPDRMESRELRRVARNNAESSSSRFTIGSKLPPGGGGSKWGRIVSGSYDESIIIWRKNQRGDWVNGLVLKQEPPIQPVNNTRARGAPNGVVVPAAPVQVHPALPAPQQAVQSTAAPGSGPAGQAQSAVMSASHLVQNVMNTSLASLGAGLSNVTGLSRALNGTGEASSSSSSSRNVNMSITGNNTQSIAQQAASRTSDAVAAAVNSTIARAHARRQTREGSEHSSDAGPSTRPHGPSPAAAAAQHQLAPITASPSLVPQATLTAPPLIPTISTAPAPANPVPHPPITLNPAPPTQNQATTATTAPQAPPQNPTAAAAPVPPAPTAQQQSHSSASRVFKLQFDARRIVCCSQDSRIFGWDFANGDREVEEACSFFVGP